MSVLPLTELAARILALQPPSGGTRVVAVDGPAGSGKTTLAARLAALLGGVHPVQIVHMDDLYPGWNGLAEAAAGVAEQVIRPLAAGRPGRYRRWDWQRDRYAEWVDVPTAPAVIVEGCGSGSTPGAAHLTLLLWVEAPVEVRKVRGFTRDGDGFRPYWDMWAAQERSLFAAERTRERADLVIESGSSVAHDPVSEVVVADP